MIEQTHKRWWRRQNLGRLMVFAAATLLFAACTQINPQGDTVPPATAQEEAGAAAESPLDAGESGAAQTTQEASAPLHPALPSDEEYQGIPVGYTEDGFLYKGEPDAPVVMIEYSDFQCPFCNRYFVQTEPAVDAAYVRTGDVRVVFHDLPLESLHANAPAAHEASLCVAEQGSAEAYWEMNAELFRSVDGWESATDPAPHFAQLAEDVGADMDDYNACLEADEVLATVQERVQVALDRGFNGTPSFQLVRNEDDAVFELVGAQPYEQFEAMLDPILAGDEPQTAQQQQQPEQQQPQEGIPFWATEEGWEPDPDRPGYNIAGDQYRGDVDAPVTVIEFSDFQCPYCKRHHDETQPVLDEQYVETGQVLWVFKHFPLSIHAQAPAAGVAAECAAEQGMFWEMNDRLFADQQEWSISDPSEVFVGYADELGLDTEQFSACLDSDQMAARVDEDMEAGASYVRGTPTFIVIRGDQGSIIPGALPAERFIEVLDEELAAAGQ